MANSLVRWLGNFFASPAGTKMDLKRRRVITAGVVGIGGGLLFHAQPLSGAGIAPYPDLIRPPGALAEEDFLGKCIRCGECMKVCPTNVVQPARLEAGVEGMWSPVLKTDKRHCEYTCNACLEVCPTGAIQPLTLERKQKLRIGLAHIDKNRCLPYAYSRPCVVCEDVCPLPEKAIWHEDVTVINSKGVTVSVKQPHVNAELCIGCGLCQNKCPVSDEAAIRVTSVGESRSLKSRFLLVDQYGG
jgi:MauM/NapG family ferredoxin protein